MVGEERWWGVYYAMNANGGRMEEEFRRRHHQHQTRENQCSSALVKHIKAPVHLVWSLVRRFDQPQKYKPFVSRCVVQGDLEIGSLREVNVKSGLPATTSTERLEKLDDNEHILSVRIVGGDHRLREGYLGCAVSRVKTNPIQLFQSLLIKEHCHGHEVDSSTIENVSHERRSYFVCKIAIRISEKDNARKMGLVYVGSADTGVASTIGLPIFERYNYSSVLTLHPEVIDGRPGTLVIESFVVDVPDGNTQDETCYFVEALIKCNLKSLADVSERMAVQDRTEPIDRY